MSGVTTFLGVISVMGGLLDLVGMEGVNGAVLIAGLAFAGFVAYIGSKPMQQDDSIGMTYWQFVTDAEGPYPTIEEALIFEMKIRYN